MLNNLFGSKQSSYEPRDMLIVIKDDGTADISPVLDINSERVYADSFDGDYSVPLADVKSYTGRRGRVFLYPSTVENITDCQNIAKLERSTVLKQITHYADPAPEAAAKLPFMKFAMIFGGVVLLLILLMR